MLHGPYDGVERHLPYLMPGSRDGTASPDPSTADSSSSEVVRVIIPARRNRTRKTTSAVDLPFPTPERIQVGDYLSSGRLWDVFHADLVLPSARPSLPAIIKFLVPQPGCRFDTYSEHEMRRAVVKEDVLYRGPLKTIQGTVVPRYYGLWAGILKVDGPFDVTRDVWGMMIEDVGDALEMGFGWRER